MPTSAKPSTKFTRRPNTGVLFYLENGRKRDSEIHDAILAEGDNAAMDARFRERMKAKGLSPERIDALLRVPIVIKKKQREFDESEHPRDEQGKFTDKGGGEGGSGKATGTALAVIPQPAEPPKPAEPPLDPAVTDVGGDKWNKETAVRLEREYQKVVPALEKIVKDAVEGKEKVEAPVAEDEEQDEDAPYVPETWDEIGTDQQEEIFEAWKQKTFNEFLQDEQNSWYESGNALDDAKYVLADNGPEQEWVSNALDELAAVREEEGDKPIPFTNEQIVAALQFHPYETGYEGSKDLSLDIDDDKLTMPSAENLPPEASEPVLPGIEPPKPADYLTDEMRDAIEKKLIKAFNDKADQKAGDMEPPDYLSDNTAEYQDMYWGESMSNKDKFEWAKDHGHIEDPGEAASEKAAKIEEVRIPNHFDPLGQGGGNNNTLDYRLTKILATKLSTDRSIQLMVQRGVFESNGEQKAFNATRQFDAGWSRQFDNRLWSGWKGSSSSLDGRLIQAAVAAELGGRLRGVSLKTAQEDAEHRFASAGGWEGLKAYIRAKWEATQYLLEKAGIAEINLYRGMNIEDHGREEKVKIESPEYKFEMTKLPDLKLERNGAQSTTTNVSVANNWKGVDTMVNAEHRVVFRLQIPRTAAISIPAYGQNIYEEREVVVGGTAWKKWDAWQDRAPTFEQVPLAA